MRAMAKSTGKRVAIYLRVSTTEQTTDNQRRELEAAAVHMIVPGGGIALDGKRWLSCQPRFLLPVPVLTKLFQGLMLAKLLAAHKAGRLTFFGQHAHLAERKAFAAYLAPLRRIKWYVYAKPPFGGPKAVLAYLSRYTHRVAISNRRLIASDQDSVTFRYKDYRADGRARFKRMTLATDEFIRRFLIHVLPKSFHRIRYYGLFANGRRAEKLALCRQLLDTPVSRTKASDIPCEDEARSTDEPHLCPCCGGRMIIVETFEGPRPTRSPSPIRIRIDTS
jgi:Putative transposase